MDKSNVSDLKMNKILNSSDRFKFNCETEKRIQPNSTLTYKLSYGDDSLRINFEGDTVVFNYNNFEIKISLDGFIQLMDFIEQQFKIVGWCEEVLWLEDDKLYVCYEGEDEAYLLFYEDEEKQNSFNTQPKIAIQRNFMIQMNLNEIHRKLRESQIDVWTS